MSKTILIVDDSATMLMSVKATLEMNGYKVETAADGCKAISKLRAGLKADMVITDINMPNMGGLELIQQVRALPGYRFKPILTLTTESQAAKRDEARKLGATGWLVKPIPGPELVEVVRQVMPG